MVKLYTYTRQIDDDFYSGRIPARSWEEAQELIPFAQINGELVADYEDDYCEYCDADYEYSDGKPFNCVTMPYSGGIL